MVKSITHFDHAVILVNDIEHTGRLYERLGFNLSPVAAHSADKGTANRIAVFPGNYFELLTVIRETEDNERLVHALKAGDGLRMLAFGSDDAASLVQVYQDNGVPVLGPGSFSRDAILADGSITSASFTIAIPQSPVPHEVNLFFCQHHNPGATYQDGLPAHPNGVTGITSVMQPVTDFAALSSHIQLLFAADSIDTGSDKTVVSVRNGDASICFIERSHWPYAGETGKIVFSVASLTTTRAWFDSQSISCVPSSTGLMLEDIRPFNLLMEFVQG